MSLIDEFRITLLLVPSHGRAPLTNCAAPPPNAMAARVALCVGKRVLLITHHEAAAAAARLGTDLRQRVLGQVGALLSILELVLQLTVLLQVHCRKLLL